METLMLLTYGALCFAAFRVFKVPVNGYTVVTAIMGGVVMIGVIMLAMNYNHPYTTTASSYFITTPVVPSVGGHVVEVPLRANQPLQKGDVLFRIDPEPYRLRVRELEARRASIEADIRQDQDRLAAAEAQLQQAESALVLAEEEFTRTEELVEKGAIPRVRLDEDRNDLNLARGNLERARADALLSRDELGALVEDGVNAKLAEVEAQLDAARWNLDQATVRAPSAGYVAQLALREGFMAVPFPLRPSMVFVSERRREVAASFRQIATERLTVGSEAEIAFYAVPGTVFSGRIVQVLDVIASGEFTASGNLIAPEENRPPGRVVALIELDDAVNAHRLPGGSAGHVAVYSEHWEMFAIIRKILLRMKAWTFYLSMDH